MTIYYPKKAVGPDGRKRQIIDRIPPERDAIVIWKDQFGTIHGTGFGDVESEPAYPGESIDEFVVRALSAFGRPPTED